MQDIIIMCVIDTPAVSMHQMAEYLVIIYILYLFKRDVYVCTYYIQIQVALDRGSADNVTVIVVYL